LKGSRRNHEAIRIKAERQTHAAHVKDEIQQADNDTSKESRAWSGLHITDSGRVQSQS
jgi:hypothetical protein